MNTLINVVMCIWFLALGASTLAQETAGIGVAPEKEGEDLTVKAILPDSIAAWSHAIGIGDRIIAVAQENMPPVQVKGSKLAEAVRLI